MPVSKVIAGHAPHNTLLSRDSILTPPQTSQSQVTRSVTYLGSPVSWIAWMLLGGFLFPRRNIPNAPDKHLDHPIGGNLNVANHGHNERSCVLSGSNERNPNALRNPRPPQWCVPKTLVAKRPSALTSFCIRNPLLAPQIANQRLMNSFLADPIRIENLQSPGGNDRIVCQWSGNKTIASIVIGHRI